MINVVFSNYYQEISSPIVDSIKSTLSKTDDLIANTTNSKTLLCLDLEHKGEKTVQHLNPNLPVLKKKLIDNKFKIVKKFDEILIWKKENL